MLSPHLAKKIVSDVRRLIDEDIIIVATNGIIIASTDTTRIGQFHEGAFLVCQEKKKRIITKEDENVLRGVKAGINLPIFFHGDVIGVIGITGDPKKVSPYGELLKKMTELLIQENYYIEQLQLEARTLETFVFEWLQAHEWSPSFYERAQLFHIDLYAKRRVIIASLDEKKQTLSVDIWKYVRTVWNDARDVIVRWGNDRLLILQTDDDKERTITKIKTMQRALLEKYGMTLHIGCGKMGDSKQAYHSYKQAERALHIAKQTGDIVFDEDLRLDMCLEDISLATKQELIKRTIAPLMNEQELLHTLRTFFANHLSLKQTAEALHIHINTLHYRLKKVQQYTNLNVRHIEHVVTLYLAIRFLDETTKK
ncbi:sugar diacid utilization regulator [Anoxybacillus flavithermus NBRC 109594]|uniref:Sugar diacid utilization regulator n=1 Tax=Anoxybacillus flavithermus NBRC 109594 TaxID=1315967 RepID=R4FEU2_9BACL|nr:sugar diacid recognition domain-containing protein [Anoxybacillus flavithermus]GAC91340.1 sugar diacid utilization regulator [Anoxybacillus flavithermus NBRC 109594]